MNEKIKLEYRVPYADTDQMGVVYYANYFVYFENRIIYLNKTSIK